MDTQPPDRRRIMTIPTYLPYFVATGTAATLVAILFA